MFRRNCHRFSTSTGSSPVNLAFKDWTNAKCSSSQNALLIMHGLLGNKNNWSTLCSRFQGTTADYDYSALLLNTVRSLDMRNHGESPHSPTHSLDAMADDLELAVKNLPCGGASGSCGGQGRNLPPGGTVVMGHSMGGATLIHALLRHAHRKENNCEGLEEEQIHLHEEFSKKVQGAIIVDINALPAPPRRVEEEEEEEGSSPPRTKSDLQIKLEALNGMPLKEIKSLDHAHKFLKDSVPNDALRNFMLTNLRFYSKKTTEESNGEKVGAYWISNISVLADYVAGKSSVVGEGPNGGGGSTGKAAGGSFSSQYLGEGSPEDFDGAKVEIPTLFIYGEKSEYNIPEGKEAIPHYFDNIHDVITIPGAGHFVHHEKKDIFVEAVTPFLKKVLHAH